MGLVAAKCTQCGADIGVDATKEVGVCAHCNTAFIAEKVISNDNTYVSQHVTKNIFGKEKTETQEFLRNADAFIKLGDYRQAKKQLNLAITSDPSNWRVWFGMMRLSTKNFSDVSDSAYENYLKYLYNAQTVMPPDEQPALTELCAAYEQKLTKLCVVCEQEKEQAKQQPKRAIKECRLTWKDDFDT
ncbi:MAG: hypothetical protein FWD58_02925 [Firmicutes bacterium]|nr:hypothetical protein [Bacillota bacterium]